jgi:hypothetical protein
MFLVVGPILFAVAVVCMLPFWVLLLSSYLGLAFLVLGVVTFGYLLYRIAWTVSFDGAEVYWRSALTSGRYRVEGLDRIATTSRRPFDVDSRFASGQVVLRWRDGQSIRTVTGPGFAELAEALIARSPGVKVDLGRRWAERHTDPGGRYGRPPQQ